MSKRHKYRPRPFTYGIVGRLPSGCSHIHPISRPVFRGLLKRFGAGARQESIGRRRGSREWCLNIASSQHLATGYTYQETYLYVVRS